MSEIVFNDDSLAKDFLDAGMFDAKISFVKKFDGQEEGGRRGGVIAGGRLSKSCDDH